MMMAKTGISLLSLLCAHEWFHWRDWFVAGPIDQRCVLVGESWSRVMLDLQ